MPTLGQERAASDAQAALPPSLSFSPISIIEGEKFDSENLPKLSGSKLKTALALIWNVEKLADKFGVEHVGFLTLTFRDAISRRSIREAQKRFNSLQTNLLKHRYPVSIRVVERGGESGHVHFHLLIVLEQDIRTGCDWEQFEVGKYGSAPLALRQEWAWLRKHLGAYGFGRHELLPVKSTQEGIARYVGKYIAKSQQRPAGDRCKRLVRYSQGFCWATKSWSWAAGAGAEWRRKVAQLAGECGFEDSDSMAKVFGPRWAFHLQKAIMQIGQEREGKLKYERQNRRNDSVVGSTK